MELNSCAECVKTFSSWDSLRRHVRKFHPTKSHELAPLKKSGKVFKFPCDTCSKKFNYAKHLIAHKIKFHNLTPKTQTVCPLCSEKVAKNQFETHLENLHDLPLIKENIEFPSYDYFIKWKNDLEQKEETYFVKNSGIKRTSSFQTQKFCCHRSGNFQSQGKGKRRVKIQGSKKINSYCPASIKLTLDSITGICSVVYLKTHVGHRNELCHLTITKKQREVLAAKIAQKIPFNKILNEVRDSISNEKLERLHLLTRKDLLNIESSFNLNTSKIQTLGQRHTASLKPNPDKIIEDQNGAAQHVMPDTAASILLNAKDKDIQIVDTADDYLQKQLLVAHLSKKQIRDENLTEKKQEFINEIKTLIDYVSCADELDILKKCAAPVKATINALRMSKETEVKFRSSGSVKHREPDNKRISQQMSIFDEKEKKILQKISTL
ncbi:hypothetical protein NQ314_011653 [Rhamnusium bicolor]|uniref:C2H2-type domain-containing protein n=1 Tax=Rhamnusium bicolor TaxID=1586634 RepID=A0AAV8XHF3_9CUCU|nr:hypothetical protein NQ314_011653 [Rhamnusium bicolor]